MNFVVTAQAGNQERPIVREFETKDEASDYIQIIRKEVEESRVGWKITPRMEITQ